MGLAEFLLGAQNPFAQWTNQNQNLLGAIGAGLGQGQNIQSGLSAGIAAVPQAKALDYQATEKRKADAKVAAQTDAFKSWLSTKRPDLVPLLDAGVSSAELFNQAMAPAGEQKNPYMSAGDGKFFNWQTGQFVNDPNAQPAQPDYPTSYDEFLLAQKDPAYAATLASGTSKPPTDADVRTQKLASVVQGDKALLLGDGTNKGIYDALADPWSQIVGADVGVGGVGIGKPGYALTSADFQSAQNALTNIAQSYLYAISGQAAPAGEVAKIVQSVTPVLGENKDSVANKKKRLASYIAAIEMSKQDVQGGAMGGGTSGEWTVLGVE